MFAPDILEALHFAGEEAKRSNSQQIQSQHLLLAILTVKDSLASRALRSLDVTADMVRQHIQPFDEATEEKKVKSEPLLFDSICQKILRNAERHADILGHAYASVEHILLGMVEQPECQGTQLLKELQIDCVALKRSLTNYLQTFPIVSRQPSQEFIIIQLREEILALHRMEVEAIKKGFDGIAEIAQLHKKEREKELAELENE